MIRRLFAVLPVYAAIYSACYLGATLLRFDFTLPDTARAALWTGMLAAVTLKCAALLLTSDWRRKHRYTALADVYVAGLAPTAAACALAVVNELGLGIRVPRSVLVIDWTLTVLATAVLRVAIRWCAEHWPQPAERRRALVYGADEHAVRIHRALHSGGSEYQVVGFVSEEPRAVSTYIAGAPVIGGAAWLEHAARLGARHLLVPASFPGKRVRELVEACGPVGITTHVIPGVDDIVAGNYKFTVRDVTISDLLRREPNQLDMESIRGYVTGKRVLVTGAAGSIGSELCRQILALRPASLVLFDQSESGMFAIEQEFRHVHAEGTELHYVIGDVLDDDTLPPAMHKHAPELVFHAAAYKHVPLMEDNPQEAIRNNVFGTKNVVDAAQREGVEVFVLVSTDKAVRPSSVMGSTKLVAEKYLQAAAGGDGGTRFVTVRFGNVLNSVGSVVPTFRKQIEQGGPLTVTHPDMERYFMTIPEAVQLVLQAGAIGESGDLLILDMGQPVKIVDLAKDMIYLSGLRYPDDIDIEFTGMRPGEKLVEELFYESEEGVCKVHDKIFRAARDGVSMFEMARDLQTLRTAAARGASPAAKALRELVTRYVEQEQGRPAEQQTTREQRRAA